MLLLPDAQLKSYTCMPQQAQSALRLQSTEAFNRLEIVVRHSLMINLDAVCHFR